MALAFFKSPQEEPWDRFSHRMDRALDAASSTFKARHNRHLRLGSPVKLPGGESDVIRVPIEVRGGPYEYAIAYLETRGGELGKADGRRMDAIAREAAQAAAPYLDARPEKPGEVVFRYP
jgi:hypothetical protein